MALRPGSAIVVPTKPAGQDPTTAAAPAPTPTSDAAPETAPAKTSSVRPPTAAPVQNTEPNDPPKHTENPATKTSQGAVGNANNEWPLPPVITDTPTTTNALSVLLSAMSSKAQAEAAAHTSDDNGDSNNGQQQAGNQASNPPGDQSGSVDPGRAGQGEGSHESHAQSDNPSGSEGSEGTGHEAGSQNENSQQSGHDSSNGQSSPGDSAHFDDSSNAINPEIPANGGQPGVTWNYDGQAFTAISSNGAVIVQGSGTKSTLAAGATATFEGQVIEVPSVGNAVVINGAAVSFTSPAGPGNKQSSYDPPTTTFTESGQVFTVAVQGSSLVIEAAGSTTTMAYGAQGTFAGRTVSMPSSPGVDVINVNDKPFIFQGGSDESDGKESSPRTQMAAAITQDGKTFTAIMQGASTVVLEAASTTLTIPPGAAVTLDGEIFSVPTAGSILVHDGTTFTFTPITLSDRPSYTAAVTGEPLSAFDVGSSIIIVADGSTFSLVDGAQTTIGEETFSAASTGGAVIVNGTSTLSASTRTNVANPSANGEGGVETSAGTGQDSEGAASGYQSFGWTSILLMVGSCVVMWL